MKRPRAAWGALAAALLCAAVAAAQPAAAPPAAAAPQLARDLNEEVQRIAVRVKDLRGQEELRQIPVTIFRPSEPGRHPLVIMNHGRATADKRAAQGRSRYEPLARYLVGKGFVVLVPTRVGYGETYGGFDPEASGSCNAMVVEPMAVAASTQVLAALDFARTLPYVDASRWLVMGQSVGGLTALATAWRRPPGLVGAINFAGGSGGNPELRPGNPCSPQQIERMWGRWALLAEAVPTLWLYWENDLFWGSQVPRRWHRAWLAGGGQAELHLLPPAGKDGHQGLGIDMDRWVPVVEDFLARLGFRRSGVPERPPASGFAALADEAGVPIPPQQASFYRRFLDSPRPRAFAIGQRGSVGWASGDWALGRALGFCQQRGDTCRLYAVDDDVVWPARPAQ